MSAGLDEHLRNVSDLVGTTAQPLPTVQENKTWSVWTPGLPDIDLFDLRGTVGDTLRRTDRSQRRLVPEVAPAADDPAVERIDRLVVSLVESLLIEVHPDQRALGA